MFYLHLNTENDAQLLAKEDNAAKEAEPNPAKLLQKSLPRKPLSETSRSSLDARRQSYSDNVDGAEVEASRSPAFSTAIPVRKPLTSETSSHAFIQADSRSKDPIQRKPLGPRPLLSDTIGRKPLHGEGSRSLVSTPLTNAASSTDVRHSRESFSEYENCKTIKATKSFTITIIRRDPSSGAQWNVGSIVGGTRDPETSRSHSKKTYSDILIALTTPGYGQFRTVQMSQLSAESSSGFPVGPPVSNSPPVVNDGRCHSYPGSDLGFVREVHMEGSSFWGLSSKPHKRALSDSPYPTRETSTGSNRPDSPELRFSNSESPSDSGTKGYVFTSPWGGRCKFSTGGSGRILRCKHTLPAAVSTKKTRGSGLPNGESRLVSELRFNLPSSTLFGLSNSPNLGKAQAPETVRFNIPRFGHIRNKLSPDKIIRPSLPPRPHLPHPTSYAALYPSDDDHEELPQLPPRPSPTLYVTESSEGEESPAVQGRQNQFPQSPKSPSEEDEDRLDLSIGQEKAGGGNRGKRAKLGKLIILDEGLKMLDLIVAANMGVWWSVWESKSG